MERVPEYYRAMAQAKAAQAYLGEYNGQINTLKTSSTFSDRLQQAESAVHEAKIRANVVADRLFGPQPEPVTSSEMLDEVEDHADAVLRRINALAQGVHRALDRFNAL